MMDAVERQLLDLGVPRWRWILPVALLLPACGWGSSDGSSATVGEVPAACEVTPGPRVAAGPGAVCAITLDERVLCWEGGARSLTGPPLVGGPADLEP